MFIDPQSEETKASVKRFITKYLPEATGYRYRLGDSMFLFLDAGGKYLGEFDWDHIQRTACMDALVKIDEGKDAEIVRLRVETERLITEIEKLILEKMALEIKVESLQKQINEKYRTTEVDE